MRDAEDWVGWRNMDVDEWTVNETCTSGRDEWVRHADTARF